MILVMEGPCAGRIVAGHHTGEHREGSRSAVDRHRDRVRNGGGPLTVGLLGAGRRLHGAVAKTAEAPTTTERFGRVAEEGVAADGEDALHAELVAGSLRGEAKALEALALSLRPHAYRLALQLLGNHEDALDCAQESLLRFFAHLGSYDPRQPLLPWVRRIVRNRAIDMLRRRRVRRADSLDTSGPEGEAIELVDPNVAEPTESLQLARRRRLVWSCLQEMNQTQKEILVLRDYQDLSYREIADELGIPTGTVMSRLHRARAELRRLVIGELDQTSVA
ncbi:MAG: RNA polymerase sigma factor [Acidobacteria bacterium]|nr:MAG: RNA polymerase sigma factor [Acidobacteriota bacterium]